MYFFGNAYCKREWMLPAVIFSMQATVFQDRPLTTSLSVCDAVVSILGGKNVWTPDIGFISSLGPRPVGNTCTTPESGSGVAGL